MRSVPVWLLFLPALFAQPGVTPAVCPVGIDSIATCPATGCGGVSDSFLDVAKNRTDEPAAGTLQSMSVGQIKKLAQPSTWKTGQDRASITVPNGREGAPAQLIAFLLKVKPQGAESANCDLTSAADTDLHLVMVSKLSDAEEKSITAEVTPRVRAAGHSNWTFGNVKPLEQQLVRITGWLMLDTAHTRHPVLLPGEHPRTALKRATNWEIHPITQIETCTGTIKQCKAGSGWQPF